MWLKGPRDRERQWVNEQWMSLIICLSSPSSSLSLFLLPHPTTLPCPTECLWWSLHNITKETTPASSICGGQEREVMQGALTQYLMNEKKDEVCMGGDKEQCRWRRRKRGPRWSQRKKWKEWRQKAREREMEGGERELKWEGERLEGERGGKRKRGADNDFRQKEPEHLNY